jgi:hypothetical protein
MIDWFNLLANSLWVLGLALALALVSYASWLASQRALPLRIVLAQPPLPWGLDLAGALFALGMGLAGVVLWQKIVWLCLAAVFIVLACWPYLQRRKT